MERNSSGALRAPGAFGASGTSDPHAIISSCSLHITHVCWLAAVLRPSAAAPLVVTSCAPFFRGVERAPGRWIESLNRRLRYPASESAWPLVYRAASN
jgi:hypothetical protein